MNTSDNLIYEQAYKQGYEAGFRKGCQAMTMKMNEKGQQSCANCANCPKTVDILFGGASPVCSYFHDCLRNSMAHWKAKEVFDIHE